VAILAYFSEEKWYHFDLSLEKGVLTCLKVNQDHMWNFSSGEDLHETPLQVLRADNGFYVVITDAHYEVRVNGIRVFGLRVLRNADAIHIGQEKIRFYEWMSQEITIDSRLLGIRGPMCKVPFIVGARVVLCPKCDTPLHDHDWYTRKMVGEGCAVPNCGYIAPEEEPYIPSNKQ